MLGGELTSVNDKEHVAVKKFFQDFEKAYKSGDFTKIKEMSGSTWRSWSRLIEAKTELESIKVADVEFKDKITASAEVSVLDAKKGRLTDTGRFIMKKNASGYCIDQAVNHSEGEVDDIMCSLNEMIAAINAKDFKKVKQTLTFGDAADFEQQLALRGLMWIKEAVDTGVTIPKSVGVHKVGGRFVAYDIKVPIGEGGTNVIKKVSFKNGKIDRAARSKLDRAEQLRQDD